MNNFGMQPVKPNKETEVSELNPEKFDESDISIKVSANALKNFHILSVIFAYISAGFLVVDLAAMVVVLTAYVFSVLSVTVAMNVLIILGILAVVFLVGIVCGTIVSSAAKRKMIKDIPKPNPPNEANQNEKNPVEIVGYTNVLNIKSNKLEKAEIVFKNSNSKVGIELGLNILELKKSFCC
jgi:hypothetical protein